MALYTILFGLSIFMIALVLAIIRKMFYHWKAEQKKEKMTTKISNIVQRPAVSAMIYTEKCVLIERKFNAGIVIYDLISKSDISLGKRLMAMSKKEVSTYSTADEEAKKV